MFRQQKKDSEKEAERWMKKAKCKNLNPSVFFPSDGAGVEIARRICKDCQVKIDCLEYALENHIDHGVWGGTSERERRRILKMRKVDWQNVRS
jgi:WhiB family redox-sensing transcriptional regulator